MKKMNLIALLVLPLALAVFTAPSAQASDLHVALFVHTSDPLPPDSPIVQAIAALTAASLDLAPRIDLIPFDHALMAERALKIHVSPDSTPREIRAIADVLKADAIVLLTISVRPDGLLVVNAFLFGNDGNRITMINSAAFHGDNRDEVQQAMADVLNQLIPAVLQL
jgi:nucleotide-binding universal stress UspA family protein